MDSFTYDSHRFDQLAFLASIHHYIHNVLIHRLPLAKRFTAEPLVNIDKVYQAHAVARRPVDHRVESVPLRLSPIDPGSTPARGPLLHVLPSLSQTFLSIAIYNKA